MSGGAKAPRRPNGNIDWDAVFKMYIRGIIKGQQAPNTTRGLMYILLSKQVLQKSDYGRLSEHLVDWRKAHRIEWIDIADGSGRGLYEEYRDFEDLDDFIEQATHDVRHCGENYRYLLEGPWKWYYQPHYVEFWSEKHAVVATIAAHIKGHYIQVAFNRGNPGWGYMRENCLRLSGWRTYDDIKTGERKTRKIHIWYLGDSDTYGLDMDRQVREQLSYFGLLHNVEFKRIAVVPEQIAEYGLIESFDQDKGYEIDGLNAFNPNAFGQLLLDHVVPYFDKRIHKQVLKKFSILDINRLARSSLDEDF